MPKWADFLISGVWKTTANNSTYVSQVLLHQDLGESISPGVKRSKDEVIALIKNKRTVCTIRWSYPQWNEGALVGYEKINGVEYLRSHPDATVKDNIDNLLPMGKLGN